MVVSSVGMSLFCSLALANGCLAARLIGTVVVLFAFGVYGPVPCLDLFFVSSLWRLFFALVVPHF
eukprot:6473959-Lingulodinium_polyedra.AAC.1